ncbi:MAG: phage tail protein [Dysgonamonadaceae bacterium]|jgi:phage tail-like protein|nr:phage tail protein [Dysgonamonadaceae bacterium]
MGLNSPPLPVPVSTNKQSKPANSTIRSEEWALPVAFYFKVIIQGEINIGEIAFKEVSGLSYELETETIGEGGVNGFEYKLPKGIKHGNLIMKRAVKPMNKLNETVLNRWLRSVFNGEYASPIQTETILIQLLNENGVALHQWMCKNAYPVKYEMENFDAEKNGIAIESMEFAYTSINRDK